jgi:molybdenum cofactor cytidylyltransferase
MIFAALPIAEAEGAVLAHGVRGKGLALKKGHVLTRADIDALRAAGVASVTAAKMERGDLGEDEAARRVAAALGGENLSLGAAVTGRCNLYATARGVLALDHARLDALNLIDEAITAATLPPFTVVEPRQMVATVKIIPYAVAESAVQRCEQAARAGSGPLLRVAAFAPKTAALIQTELPGTKRAMLDKTVEVTRQRMESLGGTFKGETRCAHDAASLADKIAALRAGADILLISGASAISDRRDVIPAAIERAGGRVVHLGMPVDPGNLILLGELDGKPVLGLPGCARSPRLNGFDWVLQRLMAGIAVAREDIMRMGAGGLLAEIPQRPLPRAEIEAPASLPQRAPRIAAVVLAAGLARRMGSNKLLAPIDGAPMIARAVDAALASEARPVIVVTGNEAEKLRAALTGRAVTFVHNPDFAQGLSASIKRGVAAVPPECDGALICLGDMPRVAAEDIDRLIAAFNPVEGRAICVPVRGGKRGNPVLWARRFFGEMQELAGDAGAKHLIGAHGEAAAEVAMEGDGVLIDIDTPLALAGLAKA